MGGEGLFNIGRGHLALIGAPGQANTCRRAQAASRSAK
jgi:hypothetical protein